MTTFSYSQQQLLNVLQIKPVKLADAFAVQKLPADDCIATDSASPDSSLAVDIAACAASSPQTVSGNLAPDLSHILAQDIQLALPDGVSWGVNLQAAIAAFKDHQLITPALSELRHAAAKKALWQLLSSQHED
jgi:DNA polymerase III psi subunit